MPVTNSDAVLHYNIGVFGDLGYGVPNPSDDFASLNPTIHEFVSGAGAQLFTIMHHPDADMRTAPRLNTLMRIHRLYESSSRLLAGRMVPSNQLDMEAQHIQSGGHIFLAHPCPYFQVRNRYLKRWAGNIMLMISEAMQHTENRRPMEISENFAGLMGQYLRRVYREMAIELFGKTREELDNPLFLLTQADFDAYNPSSLFPGTESYDTVPPLNRVMTEDQLGILRDGIPYTQLPNLKPWPVNIDTYYDQLRPGGMSPAAVAATGNRTGGQDELTPQFDNEGPGQANTQTSVGAGLNTPLPPAPLG